MVQIPQKISLMADPDQTIQINIAPIKQATEQPKEEKTQVVEQDIKSNQKEIVNNK